MTQRAKMVGLLIVILVLGYMPSLYGMFAWTWLPHNRWVRIIVGPVAVIASAALAGGLRGVYPSGGC
jgi:uncharacterized membrane protein YqjE